MDLLNRNTVKDGLFADTAAWISLSELSMNGVLIKRVTLLNAFVILYARDSPMLLVARRLLTKSRIRSASSYVMSPATIRFEISFSPYFLCCSSVLEKLTFSIIFAPSDTPYDWGCYKEWK